MPTGGAVLTLRAGGVSLPFALSSRLLGRCLVDCRSLVARFRPLSLLLLLMIVAAGPAAAGVVVATPSDFTVAEATDYNDVVATFTDSDKSTNADSFTASIDWGDGTPVTPGPIAQSDTIFLVIGEHTY